MPFNTHARNTRSQYSKRNVIELPICWNSFCVKWRTLTIFSSYEAAGRAALYLQGSVTGASLALQTNAEVKGHEINELNGWEEEICIRVRVRV